MEVRNTDAMELVALGDHLDQVRSLKQILKLDAWDLGLETLFSFAFQHLVSIFYFNYSFFFTLSFFIRWNDKYLKGSLTAFRMLTFSYLKNEILYSIN